MRQEFFHQVWAEPERRGGERPEGADASAGGGGGGPDFEHAASASGMVGTPNGGLVGETGKGWAAFAGTAKHPGVPDEVCLEEEQEG
jgi:hypothetical protein